MIRQNSRLRTLQRSDPGRILNLCANLLDDSTAILHAKINAFIQEETESELVLQVVVMPGRGESYVEALGTQVLPKRRKLYMPELFLDLLKRTSSYSCLVGGMDPEFKCLICSHLGESSAKRRLVSVPLNHNPFSLLVFAVQPANMQEDDLFLTIQETFIRRVLCQGRFVWPTLQNSIACDYERTLKIKCQQLLKVARRLFTKVGSLNALLRLVMREAKRLAQADACSVLLVDTEYRQLFEMYFKESKVPSTRAVYLDRINTGDASPSIAAERALESETSEDPSERRWPLDIGIAGHVLSTGELRNVSNPAADPLFCPLIDARPGYVTKNLLCFPIRDETGIVGVGQLFNKLQEPFFDACDEEMALAFSTFCGVCVAHSLVYRRVEEAYVRGALAHELMMYHMQVTDAEVSRVDACRAKHSHPHLASLHLNVRALPPREMPCYVLHMFNDLGLVERFNLSRDRLIRFVLYAQKGYREMPYHNWLHAFSVAQFAYAAIKHWRLREDEYLSELQCLMYLIAALVHDLDHRGTTNSFHTTGESPLAALYSSSGSVMERHHLALAMCILNTDGCDVLSSLPRRDYDRALMLLRDYILATDLSNYFKKAPEYHQLAADGYVRSSRIHAGALMALLMNAADMCDQLKDWSCVKRTAAAVLTEFFHQGQMEKSRGDLPVTMMDQEKAFIPDLEISFITTTTIPLFQLLERMVPRVGRDVVQIMENHIERWEACRPIFAEVPTTAGMAVLLSPELDALIEINLKKRQLERERLADEGDADEDKQTM